VMRSHDFTFSRSHGLSCNCCSYGGPAGTGGKGGRGPFGTVTLQDLLQEAGLRTSVTLKQFQKKKPNPTLPCLACSILYCSVMFRTKVSLRISMAHKQKRISIRISEETWLVNPADPLFMRSHHLTTLEPAFLLSGGEANGVRSSPWSLLPPSTHSVAWGGCFGACAWILRGA
jgi:hypothetical protein